jgi:hypothetical protein
MPAATIVYSSFLLAQSWLTSGAVGLPSRDRAQRARAARLHLDALSARVAPPRPRATSRDRAVLRALVRSFTEPPEASS